MINSTPSVTAQPKNPGVPVPSHTLSTGQSAANSSMLEDSDVNTLPQLLALVGELLAEHGKGPLPKAIESAVREAGKRLRNADTKEDTIIGSAIAIDSSPATENEQQGDAGPHFFYLPGEIRDIIYDMCIEAEADEVSTSFQHMGLPLTRVSRRIRSESCSRYSAWLQDFVATELPIGDGLKWAQLSYFSVRIRCVAAPAAETIEKLRAECFVEREQMRFLGKCGSSRMLTCLRTPFMRLRYKIDEFGAIALASVGTYGGYAAMMEQNARWARKLPKLEDHRFKRNAINDSRHMFLGMPSFLQRICKKEVIMPNGFDNDYKAYVVRTSTMVLVAENPQQQVAWLRPANTEDWAFTRSAVELIDMEIGQWTCYSWSLSNGQSFTTRLKWSDHVDRYLCWLCQSAFQSMLMEKQAQARSSREQSEE